MRTRTCPWTSVEGGGCCRFLAVWWPSGFSRDGDIGSPIGISQDHTWRERATALRIGVLRAKTIVGIADQRRGNGRSYEGLAGQGVYPVGRASASGKIMSDGLRISSVFSHYPNGPGRAQTKGRWNALLAKKGRMGGRGWPRPL